MVFTQPLESQSECLDRTFKTLEQVGGHQGLKATFSVCLSELASSPAYLRIIQILIFSQTTGKNITYGCVDGELEH